MEEATLTKPTLKKHFAKSRLSERPLIIVEGKDDISFYDKISKLSQKKTKITAVENIQGYTEGCTGIEKLIVDVQEILEEEEINEKFFLAIIDADVRRYRNEDINLKGLLTLKYYSYESHFITPFVASKLIEQFSNINGELINDKLHNFLMNNFESEALTDFFYPSLEALKNSLENDYIGLIGYGKIPNSDPEKTVTCDLIVKNEALKNNILEKNEDLDVFASSLNISQTYIDLLKICKGKWILEYFTDKVIEKFNNAKSACANKSISQCQYCENLDYDKCLYKPNVNLNKKSVASLILNYLDKEELKYIIERFMTLN
jgi:hypothetical protein